MDFANAYGSSPIGASGYAYAYIRTMGNKRKYPQYLKALANLHDRVWPEYSERLFIQTMGQWFFWRHNFKHQGTVGPYRPDFVSYTKRLIIEIDGKTKEPKDVVKLQEFWDYQQQRDSFLHRRGYSVLHWQFRLVRDYPREVKRETKRWAKDPTKYKQGRWS